MIKGKILLILIFFSIIGSSQSAEIGGNILSDILHPPNISLVNNDPGKFLGKNISLKGMVTTTYPKEHRFIFTDKLTCASCAAAKGYPDSIQVLFSGKMPANSEIIQVSGQLFRDTHNKITLNASVIKR